MKYIIDIPKTVGMTEKVGSVHYTYFDGIQCKTIILKSDDIEELNSDYINEHFGDLQDTAYQRGVEDGAKSVENWNNEEKKLRLDEAYQRGLYDAWKAAKKIALMDTETSENVTGYFGLFRIMENLTPMQAIEKLKAYEEKQKEEAEDEIKVGDEVAFHHDDGRPDTVVVVTYIGQDGFIDGMDGRGTQYAHKNPTKWTKTGRHFDIDKILEEMRND